MEVGGVGYFQMDFPLQFSGINECEVGAGRRS